MYIELFVVAGQSAELENALKKVVEELRAHVQRPDKVRLATVKIRPDAVEQVIKLVGEPPDKVPPHYRSLVNMLKKYGITKFPAVVVDGAKVGEGDLSIDAVLKAVQDRARAEFPELSTIELVPPRPTPAPIQPVEVRPLEPAPEPLKPPEPPRPPPVELPKPPEAPRPVELPPPAPEAARPEPPRLPAAEAPPARPPEPPRLVEAPRPLTAVVKLVLGRPDNCAECAYYGQLTSRCFLFGFTISNPASPPCKQYVRSGG